MTHVRLHRFALRAAALAAATAILGGCLRPGEERARLDDAVGSASTAGLTVDVVSGLAAVRDIDRARVELWAQAPTLAIALEATESGPMSLVVRNAMSGSRLRVEPPGGPSFEVEPATSDGPATRLSFDLALDNGSTRLQLVPPGADDLSTWRFAFLADIQTGLDDVGDMFTRINADPAIQFAVFGGDATEDGQRSELTQLQAELENLNVPLYATPGNHELIGDDALWPELFGLRNLSFAHRGGRFTLVDSSQATLDELVYDRLERWLDDGVDDVHVFTTHVPPFDPVGVRGGAWRNRREAAALYALLVEHRVDAVFAGHIHSYYAEEYAGIPTFVSGGATIASSERWDGVDRHYLAVDLDPVAGTLQVALVRVD